jgi:hypothetical protein
MSSWQKWERGISEIFQTLHGKHLAFAGPCKPFKTSSRSRVRMAIQKFWLNPSNVWNTMLPQQCAQTKWGGGGRAEWGGEGGEGDEAKGKWGRVPNAAD